MSYNKEHIIKSTLEQIKDKFEFDWEFQNAEIKDGVVYLKNHQGLKFKITMEYIGFEKNED